MSFVFWRFKVMWWMYTQCSSMLNLKFFYKSLLTSCTQHASNCILHSSSLKPLYGWDAYELSDPSFFLSFSLSLPAFFKPEHLFLLPLIMHDRCRSGSTRTVGLISSVCSQWESFPLHLPSSFHKLYAGTASGFNALCQNLLFARGNKPLDNTGLEDFKCFGEAN